MPDADYFSLEFLSSSRLKLLDKSAAHLKADIDREKGIAEKTIEPEVPTPAQVFGAAYHAYMLGYPNKIAIMPAGIDRRTKAGKEEWAEFCRLTADKIIISAGDMLKIEAMHAVLYSHPKAAILLQLKDALREAAGIWQHPAFGFVAKIKTDIVDLKNRWIIDLKSAISAHPDDFARAIANFKYHWQAGHYINGARALTGDEFKFLIIAQEKEPPFAVAVYEIGRAWLEIAARQIDPLYHLYAGCLASSQWPAYNESIIISEPPAWAAR